MARRPTSTPETKPNTGVFLVQDFLADLGSSSNDGLIALSPFAGWRGGKIRSACGHEVYEQKLRSCEDAQERLASLMSAKPSRSG